MSTKQCGVPRCGYIGEFVPVYVPEHPYRPDRLVVGCPACGRRSLFCELKEGISEFERQKREAAKEWEPLAPFRAEVMERMGWRGVKRRGELNDEGGQWAQWHRRGLHKEGVVDMAVED